MTVKLYDSNKSELMAISGLEREGDDLVIKGKIYGAMPMKVTLSPEELRKIGGLISARLIFFVISMFFRRSTKDTAKPGTTSS